MQIAAVRPENTGYRDPSTYTVNHAPGFEPRRSLIDGPTSRSAIELRFFFFFRSREEREKILAGFLSFVQANGKPSVIATRALTIDGVSTPAVAVTLSFESLQRPDSSFRSRTASFILCRVPEPEKALETSFRFWNARELQPESKLVGTKGGGWKRDSLLSAHGFRTSLLWNLDFTN